MLGSLRRALLRSALVSLNVAVVLAVVATDGAVAQAAAPTTAKALAHGFTPWSAWSENADGTVTRTLFPTLTFHTDSSGEWVPIDPTVVPAEDTRAADAATVPGAVRPLAFGRTAEQLLALDLDGGAVTLSAPGMKTDAPTVQGNAVSYVVPDAHALLGFEVSATSVKQTMTLADESAPTRFRFRLSDPNGALGNAVPTGDGGYRFDKPAADGLFLTIPAPVAYELGGEPVVERDARGEPIPSARITVTKRGDGFDIVEAVDPTWLARHELPVVLDPTLTWSGPTRVTDCAITSNPAGLSTPDCAGSPEQLGADTTSARRLLLRWDTSNFPSPAQVTQASVLLTAQNVPSGGMTISVHEAGAPWTTGATWLTRDGTNPWSAGNPGGAPGTSLASGPMNMSGPTTTMTSSSLTTLVTGWINGTSTNRGLVVKAASESAPGPGFATIHMTEATTATWQPALQITYIAPPDPPGSVTATRGDQQATVSWTAPADNGSPITGYSVKTYAGTTLLKTESAGTATSKVVTGLTNGTAYTFVVNATNAIGTGADSAPSNAVTPAGVPFAPTNVTATRGDTQATVTWTAANANGDAVTANTVSAYAGTTLVKTTTVGAVTSATVTGLSNGTTYTFKVAATNTVGTGAQSASSNAVTPAGVPFAPTGVTAVPGSGQATVTWTAANPNGAAVTANTVSAYAGTTLAATVNVGAVTSATVTGLTNGTTYTFKVAATNSVGTGPQSSASNAVIVGVPGAPTNVTATRGNQSASVSWTAAPPNGGAITANAIKAYSGTTLVSTTNVGAVTSGTVTGLTNGTEYTFKVVATNAYGSGPESAPSNAVTPAGAPFAPTNVVATRGDTQATVSWSPPANNGDPLTGYAVRVLQGTTPVQSSTVAVGVTSKTFTGLTNGTAYTLCVAATNTVGTGPETCAGPVTPAGVPGAPTSVSAARGDQSLSLTWAAPGDNGSAITSYTIKTYTSTGTLHSTTTSTTTSKTVTGLTNGTAYYATVAATNAVGTGSTGTSNTVTPAGLPTPPTSVTATRGDQSAVVNWSGAGSNGSPVTGYVVRTYTGTTLVKSETFGNVASATIGGLTNGTAYTFKVAATNGVGTGTDSAASNAVTPAGVPLAPSGVFATRGDQSAAVTWAAPSGNGSAVTGYNVKTYQGTTLVKTDTVGNVTSKTVTGLTNGTAYTFKVNAVNAVGTGPDSAASNSVTPAGLPGSPAVTSTTPGNASTVVAWTAPSNTNGSAVVSYTIKAFPPTGPAVTASITAPATSGTVTGLTNGTAYTYRVSATNSVGEGADSAATAAENAGIPAKVTTLSATRGDQSATVTWTPPASNGGDITGYKIMRWHNGVYEGPPTTAAGTASSVVVPSLVNGDSYYFTIYAMNAHGNGRESGFTGTVVPAGVPVAPANVHAVDGDQSATVSWTASNANGSPVTGYTVRAYDGMTLVATATTGGTATWTTVTGLTNGTTYTFTVTPANSVGSGAPGFSNEVTCAGGPFAPATISATPGDTTISVTWSAPTGENGAPLTSYHVKVTRPDGTSFAEIDAEPSQTQTTISGLTNGVAYDVAVAGVNRAGTGTYATVDDVTPVTVTNPVGAGHYVPLTPARIVNTQTGLGGITTPIDTTTKSFKVVGVGGVPDDGVTAVAIAVTAVSPSYYSDLTVWPAGRAKPATAALTTFAGQSTTCLVIAKVGANGQISMALDIGTSHVTVDVQGYYTDSSATTGGSKFVPLTPAQVVDTSTGLGNTPTGTTPVAANSARSFTVTGVGGVPASGVSSIAIAVTAASPTAAGSFTVYRDGDTRPDTTNVTFPASVARTSLVEVAVSDAGKVAVHNNSTGTTHVRIDVEGYYTAGSGGQSVFVPVNPARIYNTKTGQNTGTTPAIKTIATGETRSVLVAGATDPSNAVVLPATGVAAAVLSVQAESPQTAGYFQGYPDGEARPAGNILTYSASASTSFTSTFVAKVGTNGRVSFYASAGAVDLIVDVLGYFLTAPPTPPLQPTVSSATYPENAWATSIPPTPQFTFSTASLDVDHFLYAIDDPSLRTPAAAYPPSGSSSATVNFTSPGGFHTMYVQAVDANNEVSPVTSYTYGAGPGITSPADGTTTQGLVTMSARAKAGATYFWWYYRLGSDAAWAEISPLHMIRDGQIDGNWTIPITQSGGDSVPATVAWNVAETLSSDGVVSIRGGFYYGNDTWSYTDVHTVRLDRSGDAAPTATAPFGPGTLNLASGNLTVSSSDVSIDSFASDLTVSRSFNTGNPIRHTASEWEHLSAEQAEADTGTSSFNAMRTTVAASSAYVFSGSKSLEVKPSGTGASNETYANIGGDAGALRLGMQPGHSYTFTTHIYVPESTYYADSSTGYNLTRYDRAVAFFGSTTVSEAATLPPKVVGHWLKLSMRFTVPVGATQAYIRLYNGRMQTGNSDKPVYYDKMSLTDEGFFGPGWVPSLPVSSAAAAYAGLTDLGAQAHVHRSDGSVVMFAKNSTGTFLPTGDDAAGGLMLKPETITNGTAATWTLTDLKGNTVVFVPSTTYTSAPTMSSPHAYRVNKATQPGSNNLTTSYLYANGRIDEMLAPLPAGASCTSPSWTKGCRSLKFTYNSAGHLTGVAFKSHDASGAQLLVAVACYAYDDGLNGTGRLLQSWDPRMNPNGGVASTCGATPSSLMLPTTYAYDSSTGRLTSITPPGQRPYVISYDSWTGIVTGVTRTHGGVGGTSEVSSVRYGVSTLKDAANPHFRPDLSPATAATWGQTEHAARGVAIFGPGDTVSNGDVRSGTVYYLGGSGRIVNTATFGGASATDAANWHVDMTQYDKYGNVVQTLSAANRVLALNPSNAPAGLVLPAGSPVAAAALSTVSKYSADGMDLLDTFGPYHLAVVPGSTTPVGVRTHTHYDYDTGGELAHPAGPRLHLEVASYTAASRSSSAVATNETDRRSTVKRYALSSTDATGWTFKKPMMVVTDADGLALTDVTRYDPVTGFVVESRLPSNPNGGAAGSTQKLYYTSDASSPDSDCRNRPEWVHMLCKEVPAAQPASDGNTAGLVGRQTKFVQAYDYLSRPTVVVDTPPGGPARTTTTTYQNSGYSTRVSSVAVSGGVGAAVPTTTTSYDANTGLVTSVAAAATADQAATTVSTGYDDFGRVTSYNDGSGASATTTTYDTRGRISVVTDAKGTRTYTYEELGERRELPTSVAVSGVGTFTATYGPDGDVASQTWPNGVTQTFTEDQAGKTVKVRAVHGSTVWLDETVVPNAHGQWRTRAATMSAAAGAQGGAWTYDYDAAGRLTKVEDDPAGATGCSTRTYAHDATSNRVQSVSYGPGSGGACQSTTGGFVVAHRYDTADRLLGVGIDTGLTYDAFGRVTTLPARATTDPTGTAVTATYFANDLARSVSKGAATQRWTLDAVGRFAVRTDLTGATETGRVTNHYTDASDSPAWVDENAAGTAFTRNVMGLAGSLVATVDQSGTVSWKVTNLHGDVVATAVGSATAPATGYAADEFGVAQGATPGRYAWLGGKRRAGDVLGGLTLMGVRLYAPVLGRFLQVDPVPGGNDNAYEYPNDPVNSFDLDGRWSVKSFVKQQWQNKNVRSFVYGGAIFAAVVLSCGLTAGVGCAIAAGATFGAIAGLYENATFGTDRSRAGYAKAAAVGAVSGAWGNAFRPFVGVGMVYGKAIGGAVWAAAWYLNPTRY